MESDAYCTIYKTSIGSYTEKRSKFLAFVEHAETENDIKNILIWYRRKYHDARHICYAYTLGYHSEIFIANDNGEPSGTAGRPILEQIKSFGVTNVILIVVRYFGGIKLGTSGLFSAYKVAAREALEKADIENETVKQIIEIEFEYPFLDKILRILREMQSNIIEQDFQLLCRMKLSIRLSWYNSLIERLKKIESVRLIVNPNE